MSVLTSGKPGRLTRAGAPVRGRAPAADRGRAVGVSRQERARPPAPPGTRAVPHLWAVPDGARVMPGGAVGFQATPGPQRPGRTSGAGEPRGTRPSGPVPARRPAPRRGQVRLTRRGRIVVTAAATAVFLLMVALVWLAVTARAQASDSGPPPGAVYRNLTTVVVHPGQSLWSIASQAEPTADPWVVMQEIIDLNALHGTTIAPGQHLWVPHG
jgi:LysM domain